MQENAIATQIVESSYRIHTQLGPGLLESVHEVVLAKHLQSKGFSVRRQVPIPLRFEGLEFMEAFRADLIVNDSVLIEVKSVDSIAVVHKKQVLTYLRMTDLRLGFLINFNVSLIKEGIFRIVNGLPESAAPSHMQNSSLSR